MPSKKKKYNARFPAGRIKKIMQTDEEVGKVAQAVPVIISRTLELFVESLLTKSMQITLARNAKTLTPSHMKQCILSESRFDFLKDLVKNVPDASVQEDNENNAIFEENSTKSISDSEKPGNSRDVKEDEHHINKVEHHIKEKHSSKAISSPSLSTQISANFYTEQSTSTSRTPVIQYGPKIAQAESTNLKFSVNSLLGKKEEPKLHITIASEQLPVPQLISTSSRSLSSLPPKLVASDSIPPLIPFTQTYNSNTSDNLCIDEDYDN